MNPILAAYFGQRRLAERQRLLGLARPIHEYTARELAGIVLRRVLASEPRRSTDVHREVKELTGASERTIERARLDLGIVARRETGTKGHAVRWVLELPNTES